MDCASWSTLTIIGWLTWSHCAADGRVFMAGYDSFEMANRRGERMRALVPKAIAARYDRATGRIVIHLSSRLDVSFSPHDAQGLEDAKPPQLEEIEISPSGLGIHFPKLDAAL